MKSVVTLTVQEVHVIRHGVAEAQTKRCAHAVKHLHPCITEGPSRQPRAR